MTDHHHRRGQRPGWYSEGHNEAPTGAPHTSGSQPHGSDPRFDHSQSAAQAGGYGLGGSNHPPSNYPPHAGYPPRGHGSPGYAPPGYGYYSPTPGTDELHRLSFEREQRAQQHATIAIVLGLVGLFTLPIILGPLAIWQASKARSLGGQATAGLVLGWIALIWGFSGWLFFVFFVMLGVVIAF